MCVQQLAMGFVLASAHAGGGIRPDQLKERTRIRFDGLAQDVLAEVVLNLYAGEDLVFGTGGVLTVNRYRVHTRFEADVADGFVIGQFDHFRQKSHSVVYAPLFRDPARQVFRGEAVSGEVNRAVARLWQNQIAVGYVDGKDPKMSYLSKVACPIPIRLWPLGE